jgi:hypothetical protein
MEIDKDQERVINLLKFREFHQLKMKMRNPEGKIGNLTPTTRTCSTIVSVIEIEEILSRGRLEMPSKIPLDQDHIMIKKMVREVMMKMVKVKLKVKAKFHPKDLPKNHLREEHTEITSVSHLIEGNTLQKGKIRFLKYF